MKKKARGESVANVVIDPGIDGGGKDPCQGDSGGPNVAGTKSGDVEKEGWRCFVGKCNTISPSERKYD